MWPVGMMTEIMHFNQLLLWLPWHRLLVLSAFSILTLLFYVVLWEYLPQECPLSGTIKCYCIVVVVFGDLDK